MSIGNQGFALAANAGNANVINMVYSPYGPTAIVTSSPSNTAI